MPKDLEGKFKLYCESENLEVNQNQINVIKKLQHYFNQNFTFTLFKILGEFFFSFVIILKNLFILKLVS